MTNCLWYHGTTEEGYNNILNMGYFKEHTYFTPYFDSALCMGGEYIFSVLFNGAPSDYWEWVSNEVILNSRIHNIRRIKVDLLFYDSKLQRKLISENNDYCKNCNGHGELNYPEDGHHLLARGSSFAFGDDRIIELCPDCNGYGSIEKKLRYQLIN